MANGPKINEGSAAAVLDEAVERGMLAKRLASRVKQAELAPDKPSLIENIDGHPGMMVAWMALPAAALVSKIGNIFGWIGDRVMPWKTGIPFQAVRTALAAPADALKAPITNIGSDVLHGKVWSGELLEARRAQQHAAKELNAVERVLRGGKLQGRVPLVRTDHKEFAELDAALAGIKKRFGGVLEETVGEESMRHKPLEFISRVNKYDAASAEWKTFDDAAAKVKAALEKDPVKNKAALENLAESRKQFDAFIASVGDLKNKAIGAESAVRSAVQSAENMAAREATASTRAVHYASEKLDLVGKNLHESMEHGILRPVGAVRDKRAELLERKAAGQHASGVASETSAAEHLAAAKQTASSSAHLKPLAEALDMNSEAAKKAAENLAEQSKDIHAMPAGAAREEALKAFRERELEELHTKPMNTAVSKIKEEFAKRKAAIKDMPKGDARNAAMDAFKKEEGEVLSAIKKVQASSGEYIKQALKSQKRFSAAAETNSTVAALKDLGKNMGKIPGNLAKMPTHEAVYGGLYGLQQATSGYRAVRAFTTPMAALEHMYEGVTGKHASAKLILKDELPESMKMARSDYWRTSLANAFGNVVAIGVNHKYMSPSSKAGLKAIPIMMAIQGAATGLGMLLSPTNDLIQNYRKVAETKQAGGQPAKEDVAALFAAANPAMGKHMPETAHIKLGELSKDNPALLNVSQRFVDEGLTAAQMLKTIDSGRFEKEFAVEMDKMKLQAEIAEKSKDLTVGQGEMKDIDRRSDAANAKLENAAAQPVVGAFSAKLAQENRPPRAVVPSANHAEAVQQQKTEAAAGTVRA